MKLLKNIGVILIGIIFLMSSSGFLMYKSFCACTGNEKVSFFVNQEICIAEKSEPSCCSVKEENVCQSHSTDCNCDKPEITYLKLKNKLINEEVKFVKNYPVEILVVFTAIHINLWNSEKSVEIDVTYIDPPPIKSSSLDFLIQIQQLKIPHIA